MKKIWDKIKVVLKPLEPLYKLWMKFAHVLGKINTTILLTLFYFVFLGVGKLVLLINRKDPMQEKWGPGSYWKKRENYKINKEELLKPY